MKEKLLNYIEIRFWKLAQWLLKRSYGCCDVPDYVNFPDHPRGVNDQGRCISCTAGEVVQWLEEHIEVLKM